MSADSKTAPAAPEDERFVKIPRALPGQEYKAPKNYQQPLVDGFYRFAVIGACLSLPVAPAVIFFMILVYSNAIQDGMLWLWITMIIITEVIAIFVAWGISREALGSAGVSYIRPRK
jgi:cytochrome bd-type quinol oxidase subunit 1